MSNQQVDVVVAQARRLQTLLDDYEATVDGLDDKLTRIREAVNTADDPLLAISRILAEDNGEN